MFGLGKQKKIDNVAGEAATILNLCFWSIRDANKELPEKIQNDKYVLGYISGLTGAISYVSGFKKPEDIHLVEYTVFKLFFLENLNAIGATQKEAVNTEDKVYKQGTNDGCDEYAVIYKNKDSFISSSEKDRDRFIKSGLLPSLVKHLENNYVIPNNSNNPFDLFDEEEHVDEWGDDEELEQGTFTWADGDKYVGEYKDDDKYHGQGTIAWAYGKKYVGEWKDGKFID